MTMTREERIAELHQVAVEWKCSFREALLEVLSIPTIFLRHYPTYKNKQLNVSELARVCHFSRTTVYKYIGLLEK